MHTYTRIYTYTKLYMYAYSTAKFELDSCTCVRVACKHMILVVKFNPPDEQYAHDVLL